MAKKNSTIYKIKVLNWEKYNGGLKKGHHCILLSTGFLTDAKIKTLTPGGRLLYLGLLLRCGEVKGSLVEATHDLLVTFAGGSGQVVVRLLDQIQSLQLVTYEKITPFLDMNRIERKGIERKGKKGEQFKKPEKAQVELIPADAPPPEVQVGKVLVAHYCELWKKRYNANPPIKPQDAKNLKSFGEQNGVGRAKDLLDGYFKIPDTWVIKKRHDIQTLLSNLNVVAAFLANGKVVTNSELRQFDQAVSNQSTLDALRNGEI